MNINMSKRLDDLEFKLGGGTQGICVKQYFGDTAQDVQARVDRWKDGKTETDVWTWSNSGNDEITIILKIFGRKSDGSEVTREEYAEWCRRQSPNGL